MDGMTNPNPSPDAIDREWADFQRDQAQGCVWIDGMRIDGAEFAQMVRDMEAARQAGAMWYKLFRRAERWRLLALISVPLVAVQMLVIAVLWGRL